MRAVRRCRHATSCPRRKVSAPQDARAARSGAGCRHERPCRPRRVRCRSPREKASAPTLCRSRISATCSAARIMSSGSDMRHSLRGAGCNPANRAAIPRAALIRSSTVRLRTRAISACRDAAWLTLGRGDGTDGWSVIPGSYPPDGGRWCVRRPASHRWPGLSVRN
jgi:hypothetical protein